MMFANYLKTAIRNLLKNKGFSLINIFGLAIGVACCLLIWLFVQDELSYDRYNEKADRIYRVGFNAVLNNNASKGVVSCAPLKQALIDEFPEVESATRARNPGFPVFRYGDKVFSEERVFTVDSTFFDVFTVPFILGDYKTALTKPGTIVLTRSMAEKYFGEENPIGKILNADNRRDYEVTGVVEDVPRNSHFHFDFLTSIISRTVNQDILWISNNYYTYFVIKEGASAEALERKVQELVLRNAGPQVQQFLGITVEQFVNGGGVYEYFFQRLLDIHLHSHLDYEIEPNGNFSYVLIFSFVAFGILLVACINFVNLSTARSSNRAKEVGIRKTAGSTRGQLIRQFLTETIVISFLAVFIALLLVHLLLPYFNTLAGKQFDISMFRDASNITAILALILGIGLLAGTYPAFFLAAFHPVSVLRGEKFQGGRRSIMRNILVVFQFAVSIILVIGTLIVRRQVYFIQNTDLGFNKDNVVIVHKTDDLGDRLQAFKLKLLENPVILDASNSNRLIGQNFGNSVFMLAGQSGEESHLLWTLGTDADFTDTYRIEITHGRFFEEGREADQSGCILNESAVQTLGLEEPVGKVLIAPGAPSDQGRIEILGVMKDFHFESMHQKIRPLVIFPMIMRGIGRYVSVRIQRGTSQEALQYIETTWRKVALNQAFEYEFFDDHFADIYRTEIRTGEIFFSFSILTIIIACLGLFGLAAFITEQRTKEIGIRKVLGSSAPSILILLIRQFTKWILIANAIAWPVAYFAMRHWLQNFAYKSSMTLWIFLGSALLALIVAVITVSYQTIKAAVTNPVDSLKYE